MAYFPNSDAGLPFDEECFTCPLGEKDCPIAAVHLIYNYTQCDFQPMKQALALLVRDDGKCHMKPLLEKI